MTNTETVSTERQTNAELVEQLRRLVDDQEGGDTVVLVQRQLFNRVVGRLAEASRTQSPAEWQVEAVAKIVYELNPFHEGGECVDGFLVSPGGDLSWDQACQRDQECAGVFLPVTKEARDTALKILRAASITSPAPERSKEETGELRASLLRLTAKGEALIGWLHRQPRLSVGKELERDIQAWHEAKADAFRAATALETPPLHKEGEADYADYDAGLLNDFGGGDVGWWQDYLRAEIGRANDFWREQVAVPAPVPVTISEQAFENHQWPLGQRVTKTKGSSWTGKVVGFYSTALTPVGYAVESENEPGSVQIYPLAALSQKPGEQG